jgi:hypothetical protein
LRPVAIRTQADAAIDHAPGLHLNVLAPPVRLVIGDLRNLDATVMVQSR